MKRASANDSFDQFTYGGKPRRPFYEVIDLLLAAHPQTILAYELNDDPLPLPRRWARRLARGYDV